MFAKLSDNWLWLSTEKIIHNVLMSHNLTMVHVNQKHHHLVIDCNTNFMSIWIQDSPCCFSLLNTVAWSLRLGEGILRLSLLSIRITSRMVGRSSSLGSTQSSAIWIHLSISAIRGSSRWAGSTRSSDLPAVHSFQACRDSCQGSDLKKLRHYWIINYWKWSHKMRVPEIIYAFAFFSTIVSKYHYFH